MMPGWLGGTGPALADAWTAGGLEPKLERGNVLTAGDELIVSAERGDVLSAGDELVASAERTGESLSPLS